MPSSSLLSDAGVPSSVCSSNARTHHAHPERVASAGELRRPCRVLMPEYVASHVPRGTMLCILTFSHVCCSSKSGLKCSFARHARHKTMQFLAAPCANCEMVILRANPDERWHKGGSVLKVVAMIHRAQECNAWLRCLPGEAFASAMLLFRTVVGGFGAAAGGAVQSMIDREIWACSEANTFLASMTLHEARTARPARCAVSLISV